jgi:ABC-type uncharacterized transport system fused permease/ATPase subunit
MNDILLANLSIIEITFDNLDVASTLSVAILNALIALSSFMLYLFNTLLFVILILFRGLMICHFIIFFFYFIFFSLRNRTLLPRRNLGVLTPRRTDHYPPKFFSI